MLHSKKKAFKKQQLKKPKITETFREKVDPNLILTVMRSRIWTHFAWDFYGGTRLHFSKWKSSLQPAPSIANARLGSPEVGRFSGWKRT